MVATAGSPRARALSAALRTAREERGVGVRELARMLGISHTVVSHLETGHRVPRVEDVALIAGALRIPPDEREELISLAQNLSEPNWLTTGVPGIPQQLAGAMESERAATAIVEWTLMPVPGPLQTGDYARAIAMASGLPANEVEVRVMVRLSRREVFTRRKPNPVQFTALISEAVIHEPVGEPGVMVDQLHYLGEMAARPNITVQIVPQRIGWHPGWAGPFVLYEFPGGVPPMIHFEHYRSGAFVPDQDDVTEFRKATDKLRQLALSPDDSMQLIANTADELENTT